MRNYESYYGIGNSVTLMQVDTIARADYAETWKPIMTRLMEDAAKLIIPTGLLKSETSITARWEK